MGARTAGEAVKNDEFDARVLKQMGRPACGGSPHLRFSDIHARMPPGCETRALDRALQRLRKAGKVKFVARHGWIRVQPGS